jgi:hypothetical protein
MPESFEQREIAHRSEIGRYILAVTPSPRLAAPNKNAVFILQCDRQSVDLILRDHIFATPTRRWTALSELGGSSRKISSEAFMGVRMAYRRKALSGAPQIL